MLGRLASRLRHRRTGEAFGLDIGASSIKVLELHRAATSYAVARCAVAPVPVGSVVEGSIHEPALVVEAIRRAVSIAGITRTAAVIGLCGRGLIIKKLQIPEVPIKELPDAIRIEAEHEIPFAIDEVFLDFHVIGRQNRVLDLALVAARRSKVIEHRAVVAAAGLDPVVVDVDGFALGNQLQLWARPGVTAVVDIGASMTKVSVVRDGLTQLVRDLPAGGHGYTATIAAWRGASTETAEAITVAGRAGGDATINREHGLEAAAPGCEAVAQALGLEIQRTLDYFAASGPDQERVVGIVLAGGGALLAGLREHLASMLDLPVEIARPFEELTVDPACAATVAAAGPALALALGLSLRRPGDGTTT
ncbi:MAG: type IV pilus assembly protein PilM [Candidatus Rokuibacteriota bacterium]